VLCQVSLRRWLHLNTLKQLFSCLEVMSSFNCSWRLFLLTPVNLQRDFERTFTGSNIFQRLVIYAALWEVLIHMAWRVAINYINNHRLWLRPRLVHSSTCFDHRLFGSCFLVLLIDERLVDG